jgi:hypothetical protein
MIPLRNPQVSTRIAIMKPHRSGERWKKIADTAPHLLADLVDEEWGRRYGRPVRPGKNPSRPKTRILATGHDAFRLLEHLYQHGADCTFGPRLQALRQIMVQNYYRDAAGRLHWHTDEDGGVPPSSVAIVSPYDTSARYVRRGRSPAGRGSSPISPRPAPATA